MKRTKKASTVVPGKNWFFMQVNGAAGMGTGSSSGNGYATTTTNSTRRGPLAR